MRKIGLLVVAFLPVPLSAHAPLLSSQVMQPSCSVVTVHKGEVAPGLYPDQTGRSWDGRDMKATTTRTVYACDAFYGQGSVMQVTVPKKWFAQHCRVTVARDGKTPIAVKCDEIYMGAGHPERVDQAAAPPIKRAPR